MNKLQYVEMDNGKLTYMPATVIYNGKMYKAPLNITLLLAFEEILKYISEKNAKRYFG